MLRKKSFLAFAILLGVMSLFVILPFQIQASDNCPDLSSLQGSYTAGIGRAVKVGLGAGTRLTFSANLETATIAHFQTGISGSALGYSKSTAVPGQQIQDVEISGTYWVSAANRLSSNGTISITVTCAPKPEDGIPPHLLDGRINRDKTHDLAAPIVVYGHGAYDVYAVDLKTSAGNFVLGITAELLNEKGIPTQHAILLTETTNPFSNQPIKVYRLVSGEIQINTYYADGKPYTIAWSANNPDDLVHLAP